MATPQPYTSAVIPAFNEHSILEDVVGESIQAFEERGFDRYEIVLVDDGSTDGTTEVVRRLAGQNACVRGCFHKSNRGLGAALRTGFEACSGDIVTWIPSDGQFDLGDVLDAVPLLDDYDIVVAIRTGTRQSWRTGITWCFHALNWVMFRFAAVDMCGIYILRRDLLQQLKPKAENIFLNTEIPILCLKRQKRLGKFTISLKPRRAGESKVVNVKTMAKNLAEMIAIRYWRR